MRLVATSRTVEREPARPYASSPMATLLFQLDEIGGGMLTRILRDHGHRLRTIRSAAGDAPPSDLDDVGAIVLCGRGSSSPDGLASLLADAHAAELPILALGDGAAMLAEALGGAATDGPTADWCEVKATADGREEAILAGVPWTTRQFVAGTRRLGEPPAGAKSLWNFTEGGVAAFHAGLRSYGFLPRLELDLGGVRAALAAAGADGRDAETAEQLPETERLARRILESFVLFVAPIDRANQGLVKDLHY